MEFHGLIVYDIVVNNGSMLIMNGIHTTTDDFKISNEIAKREPSESSGDDILGTYKSRYIETIGQYNEVIYCDLTITKRQEAYEFKWENSNGLLQKGIGLKINDRQIAVSYVNEER